MFFCVVLCFFLCFLCLFEVFHDGGPDPRPVDSHLNPPEQYCLLAIFVFCVMFHVMFASICMFLHVSGVSTGNIIPGQAPDFLSSWEKLSRIIRHINLMIEIDFVSLPTCRSTP